MERLFQVLVYGSVVLKPKTKYVLVRLMQQFGEAGEISVGVKELALRFGVSDSHVSQALTTLVAARMLLRHSRPQGRGRPIGCYEFDASFRERLASSDVSYVCHQATICSVLRHEERTLDVQNIEGVPVPLASMWAARKPNQLDVESRLFLAVLLCHADRLGVVRSQGRTDLLRKLGLDEGQFRHRIRVLVGRGVLRAYIPGTNGLLPFGRVKSMYFINLHHPELLPPTDSGVLVHIDDQFSEFGDRASHIMASDLSGTERVRQGVSVFFPLQRNPQLLGLLRSRLNDYASSLLSSHWAELKAVRPHEDILAFIEKDLLSISIAEEKAPKKKSETVPVSTPHEQLVYYIYDEANVVAGMIKSSLMRASFPGVELDGATYAILCTPADDAPYPVVAVLVAPRSDAAQMKGYYFAVSTAKETQHQRCARAVEVVLEDADLYLFMVSPGMLL